MKKMFFNPDLVRFKNTGTGRLSRMSSRRFPGADQFGSSAYKTDAEISAEAEQLINKIMGKVDEKIATRATAAEVQTIRESFKDTEIAQLREWADPEKGLIAMLTAQGTKINELTGRIATQPEDMSLRAQCKRFIETNKETILKIRNGSKQELANLPRFELQTRAVANPMLPSTVMPNGSLHITRFEIERPVSVPFEAPITLWDTIQKGSTNAETYIWIDRKPREGAAAFIAPGVYKPNVSFTVDSDSSFAKKVAASEKMATELLQDIDGFTSWVEDELRKAVFHEANIQITTGVSSNTNPNGIRTLSVGFTNPGVSTTNPNYWDAIKAGVTMLKAQPRFASRRVSVFVNPVDKANADMTKAQEQGQLFVPFSIDAAIVEDSNIPVGYIQFAILDAYKMLMYKPFYMNWGWENDDFTKNLVTVLGEMRFHQFTKSFDAGAFVYDTYANIIPSITKV